MIMFPAFFMRPKKASEPLPRFRILRDGYGKFFVSELSDVDDKTWINSWAITPTDGFDSIPQAAKAIDNMKRDREMRKKKLVKYYA